MIPSVERLIMKRRTCWNCNINHYSLPFGASYYDFLPWSRVHPAERDVSTWAVDGISLRASISSCDEGRAIHAELRINCSDLGLLARSNASSDRGEDDEESRPLENGVSVVFLCKWAIQLFLGTEFLVLVSFKKESGSWNDWVYGNIRTKFILLGPIYTEHRNASETRLSRP